MKPQNFVKTDHKHSSSNFPFLTSHQPFLVSHEFIPTAEAKRGEQTPNATSPFLTSVYPAANSVCFFESQMLNLIFSLTLIVSEDKTKVMFL